MIGMNIMSFYRCVHLIALSAVAIGLLSLIACTDPPDPEAAANQQSAEKEIVPLRPGPHAGSLIALGNNSPNVEVKLNSETGQLDVWILDASGREPAHTHLSNLQLELHLKKDPKLDTSEGFDSIISIVTLHSSSPDQSSHQHFSGEVYRLQEIERFELVIPHLTVDGNTFKNIKAPWPEGN